MTCAHDDFKMECACKWQAHCPTGSKMSLKIKTLLHTCTPSLDGFTYNMHGHFCELRSIFQAPYIGKRKNTSNEQNVRTYYVHVKPSNLLFHHYISAAILLLHVHSVCIFARLYSAIMCHILCILLTWNGKLVQYIVE